MLNIHLHFRLKVPFNFPSQVPLHFLLAVPWHFPLHIPLDFLFKMFFKVPFKSSFKLRYKETFNFQFWTLTSFEQFLSKVQFKRSFLKVPLKFLSKVSFKSSFKVPLNSSFLNIVSDVHFTDMTGRGADMWQDAGGACDRTRGGHVTGRGGDMWQDAEDLKTRNPNRRFQTKYSKPKSPNKRS